MTKTSGLSGLLFHHPDRTPHFVDRYKQLDAMLGLKATMASQAYD